MEILNETILRKTKTQKITQIKVKLYKILPLGRYVGIDPGTTKIGVATLYQGEGELMATLLQMKRERELYAVERILGITNDIDTLVCPDLGGHYAPTHIVIEGAGYSGAFRQVELAEMRAAIVMWMHRNVNYTTMKIVAPNTIRKKVFGHGRTKADVYWPELSKWPDAAAALSCALFAGL